MAKSRALRFTFLFALAFVLAGAWQSIPMSVPVVVADDDDGGGDDKKDHGNQGSSGPGGGGDNSNKGDDDESEEDDGDDEEEGDKDKDKDKDKDNEREFVIPDPLTSDRIEADCFFSKQANQSTCLFIGVAPSIGDAAIKVFLPASEICARVLDGNHDAVDSTTNSGISGYKSKTRQSTMSLVLEGQVTTGGTATYWLESGDRFIPANGPALKCSSVPQPRSASASAAIQSGQPLAEATVEALPAASPEGASVGLVQIQAYSCGSEPEDPATFDWIGTCEAGVEGVGFSLERLVGTDRVNVGTGVTNVNGSFVFDDLAPATYRLDGIDLTWCHAESDNVDEQGALIVESGKQTTVWIFFCGTSAAK